MSSFFSRIVSATSYEGNGAATGNATSLEHHAVSPHEKSAMRREYELDFISKSGLFDAKYYLTQYADIAEAGVGPLEHFYETGYLEGRCPNFYFDPAWYLSHNADVRTAGLHPLVHYISYGDIEGRRPSLLFDPSWYRKKFNLGETEQALLHFLRNRADCRVSPIPEFDVEHYTEANPDVRAAGIDPFAHFVCYGYREGRNPSVHFDAKFYWSRYLQGDRTQNPFLHFLAHKHEPGVFGRMPEDETSIPREVKRFTRPSAEFEEFAPLPSSAPRRAKLLTYYLPQFHAFPENDAWWGKGFTEWTNIARGLPRFKGHYQPRVPRDLGFYSLNDADTVRRQVKMAKAGGVFGFVFYYYWFNGKRLLGKPTEAFLADRSIDMPFCLMWANENWTRRWDGSDTEVLISQDYRIEDESQLVVNLDRHFKDPRYIRVEGRPVLMIYRPGLIVDGKKTIARWRQLFESRGENPLLVMGQTFNATDPMDFGMDGAIEFPPHKLTQDMQPVNSSLQYLDIEFEGKAYRYDDVVTASLREPVPPYPLIKTAVPSWDNDARRQGNGHVLIDSTPKKYQAWLNELVERAVKTPFFGEPFICVNAWNEWCEGAYLEPDLHYGSAYLNATARAIAGKSSENTVARVLLVGHDGFPGGSQSLLLKIGRTLTSHYGVDISMLLLDGGKLEGAYRELGPVKIAGPSPALEAHLWSLRENGITTAIVNTSAAAAAVPALKKVGMEVTMLVHELPRILHEKNLISIARIAAQQADRIIFPSTFVRDQYCDALDIESVENMSIAPQGMYQKIEVLPALRELVRTEFGVGKAQRLIIGMGYADMRKGFDLFLQVWRLCSKLVPLKMHFCWVGDIDSALKNMMRDEILDAEATGTFHMAGFRNDVSSFLSAADGFVLSSREDPFPSVVLEALYAGLPVMAFDRSGGIPDLLRDHPLGYVVPFADTVGMAAAVAAMVQDGPSDAARAAGRDLIEQKFNFPDYVWRLLRFAHNRLPVISVAVPNYNYAKHMGDRLSSIFLQTQPVKEILVLDDCSTDDSLQVISAVALEWDRTIKILPNQVNGGSVFKQWRKAAETATGEFLWISEADDLSAPKFLNAMLALMSNDPDVKFAFSDSSAIDSDGTELWPSYQSYYATVESDSLVRTQIFDATEFVQRFLSVKNLILNVSAVVWRRAALIEAMNASEADLSKFKMAGDWRLYLQALSSHGAQVGYCAEPLNIHRRHAGSVTHALDAPRHVEEIAWCHKFARSAFSLSPATRKIQETYRKEITKQLRARPGNLEAIEPAEAATGPARVKHASRRH